MRDVALFHTIATIVEENIDHGHHISYRVRSSIAIENDLAKTSVPYHRCKLRRLTFVEMDFVCDYYWSFF